MTRINSARQTNSILQKQDVKDMEPSKPFRTAMLELFEMVSGIYQDLRGDIADTIADFFRPMRNSWRKFRN